MNKTASGPPSLATLLVALSCRPDDREVVLGDLAEEFCWHRESDGGTTAHRWYWSQALRSAGALFRFRIATALSQCPVRGALAGGMTAIVAATLFGLLLEVVIVLPSPTEVTLPQIATVATLCALVSSTCGGWAASRMVGRQSLLALGFVGLIVLAPDVLYASQSRAWNPLVTSCALIGACVGLRIGVGLWRSVQRPPATTGEI